jgi:DNA polymerase V
MIRNLQERAKQNVSGFQSPADDYLEGRLNIAHKLVIDPHCTFYFIMDSNALTSQGVYKGDLLIVDKSLTPVHDTIVVAYVVGSFYCRRYEVVNKQPCLKGDFDIVSTTDGEALQVWGVVTAICRGVLPLQLRKGKYKHVCTL